MTHLFSFEADSWEIVESDTNINSFTNQELETSIISMKTRKAPGLDKIPPEAIKLVASKFPELILSTMNSVLMSQAFPEEWKLAKVILILKGGKPPELANSYKPLCMLNTISKLMETLIRNRLTAELEKKGGPHKHQYGFQRGKSAVQALEAMKEMVEECKQKWCMLITVDVKDSFNSALHSIIMKKLRERNISSYLINIISSYLKNRKITVGKGDTIGVTAGVPQGSVLGPILWNIPYDDVLGLDFTDDACCIGFADDLALLIGAKNKHILVLNANKCLQDISNWMERHK